MKLNPSKRFQLPNRKNEIEEVACVGLQIAMRGISLYGVEEHSREMEIRNHNFLENRK